MNETASTIPVHCSHTELVDITTLIPNPRNPNHHPDAQIALLAKIIRHQGWRSPITVSNRSGFVVVGHGRLEAAKLLQVEKVPVDRQDFATEADEWAHLVADNRLAELAEIDDGELSALLKELDGKIDLELAGFDKSALDDLEGFMPESEVDAEPQIERAAELQAQWKTERGQVWSLGEHRLMCGDSTVREDVERLMAGEKAGVCFTSPPYAQQRDYDAAGKVSDWDALMQGVFGAVPMESNGQILVNLGLVHSDGEWIPYWDNWIEWMRRQGWKRFGWYVWDQGDALPGHWQGRFGPSHEFLFHFTRTAIQPTKWVECKTAGKLNSSGSALKSSGSGTSNVWETAATKIPDSVVRVNRARVGHDVDHPAVFPVGLAEYAIRSWSGIAYEPFSGGGTTVIACARLGRKCRAMEISPAYVAVALQRYLDATGKTPTLC